MAEPTAVPHVVKGALVADASVVHPGGFATPLLDLDQLVWPRHEPLPAAGVPVAEIVEVLAAAGERLNDDRDGLLQQALDLLERTSPYERRILENSYAGIGHVFDPDRLRTVVAEELGGTEVVDGWRTVGGGRAAAAVRACPARVIHVLAGNAPGVAAMSIARGALSKGVHLLKLPSNDLLTATAILRAISAAAPDHPVARSFSAAYWRGGDVAVEGTLFRPQYFDKLAAWGGAQTIENAVSYLGPGFELIAFDPKNSIALLGREVFASDDTLRSVASAAAADAAVYNQEACVASRFHFVEGTIEEVDRYCAALQAELGAERPLSSAVVPSPPPDVRDEIDSLAGLEPLYRVFGRPDGRGLVVRSDAPVEFFPSGKTVNVVMVDSLADAVQYVNVSTQTIGVYPVERKRELRDALANAGAQRITAIGGSQGGSAPGLPHDGFYPLHRMMRWVSDQD